MNNFLEPVTFLGVTEAGTIRANLDNWVPATGINCSALWVKRFLVDVSELDQNRITFLDRSSNAGTVAVIGRPMQLAANVTGWDCDEWC